MTTTITHTFGGPKAKATRSGPCPTCGKTTKRSRTFERTVSPFNRRPDGTPKSWGEVAVDVRADADAWAPEPDEFEHEACVAARMAPPAADPVVMNDEQQTRALALRLALADAILWLEHHKLPIGSIQVKVPRRDEPYPTVEVTWIGQSEVPMWARALGLDTIPLEDGGHCDYARMRADAGGLSWRVDAVLYRPQYGERLGGADITWTRRPDGKRSGFGTVAVDDFSAGLARMGVAEVLPAVGGGAA